MGISTTHLYNTPLTHTHPYVWDQLSSYANFWKTDQLKCKVAGYDIGYTNFNINLARTNRTYMVEIETIAFLPFRCVHSTKFRA